MLLSCEVILPIPSIGAELLWLTVVNVQHSLIMLVTSPEVSKVSEICENDFAAINDVHANRVKIFFIS